MCRRLGPKGASRLWDTIWCENRRIAAIFKVKIVRYSRTILTVSSQCASRIARGSRLRRSHGRATLVAFGKFGPYRGKFQL